MTAETPVAPGAVHPAITEELIRNLVQSFYAKARADELLGPIFARVADWDRHVARIADFWSGVMLRTARYDGRPLRPHLMLGLEGEHFDRWLTLFEATAREVCPGEVADAFIVRARRIADSFEMAIGSQRGEVRAPRHSARPRPGSLRHMPSSPPIDIVSPAWLAQRLHDPDLVVLDASYYLPAMNRDAEAEYRAAHIPGAIRFDIDAVKDKANPLPHMLPSPAEFAEAVGRMGIGDDMIVVAYDGMGLFSAARVAWTFRTFGAERVAVLDGGLPAWITEGQPTESGEPRPRPIRTFTPRFEASAVAALEDVRDVLQGGSAQVVDARSASRFTGEEADPRPGTRAGHMPGALNVHYGRVLKDGRLADPETIRAAFEEAGVDLERPIVTSCGSGVTATILTLALERIGRPPGRVYDGSWSEWGAREDLPVAKGS